MINVCLLKLQTNFFDNLSTEPSSTSGIDFPIVVQTTNSSYFSILPGQSSVAQSSFLSDEQPSTSSVGVSSVYDISVSATSSTSISTFFKKSFKKNVNTEKISSEKTSAGSTISVASVGNTKHINKDSVNITSVNPSKYDVATYYNKAKDLSNDDLLDLIKNVFIPEKSYPFQKDKAKRSFRHVWLETFPWLCYSRSIDGAFCFQCTLFCGKVPTRTVKATTLISSAQNHWSDCQIVSPLL